MCRRIWGPCLWLALSIILFPAPAALAQAGAAAISGTVTDSTGATVAGASVVVRNEATGVSQSITTDGNGFYSAEGLQVGSYSIDVKKTGFKTGVIQHVFVNPGQRRAQNLTLEVGQVNSQVTVTADAEQVNTQSSESGGTISSKQIDNLMLNGRNFQTLAIAIPGVSSTAGADALNGGGLEGGTTLIVNGNSVEYTTYTIDGTYNMNSGNLSNINILPIVDGIAEFSVLKDNYSAKYGLAGSGQVVVITKSGTSAFHGSAWDYLRNNAFDANNYFSTTTQPLHQNIFGYTLGGPIIIPGLYNTHRNRKTFFFASNQWYAINQGQVSRGSVFSGAMRNGDFTGSPTLKGNLTLDAHSQALLASEGKGNCITGPRTLNPSCFDPVAVGIMNAYVPLPNNPGGGFLNYINQGSLTTSQMDDQYRVDHQINQNNQLMGRVMYEQVKNGFPFDNWNGLPYSTITDSFYTTALNALVRVSTNITPNVINVASVAETYDKPRIQPNKGGTMPAGLSVIQAFPNAPTLNRIPNVSISNGWSGNGIGTEPITASDGEGIVQDDLSWVHGNHVFQGGALYIFGIKRQNVFTNPQGSFTFSGVHTGDPAADYLLGLDATYSQASSQKLGSYHYRQGEAYIQDDWKVNPKLTLNLGLRYVYFSNDTVSGDQVTSFNPAFYSSADAPVVNPNGTLVVNSANQPLTSSGTIANQLNGLVFAGKNGTPSGFFTPVKTNLGPRVGFAYDVFGNGKTAVRGGFGMGYSRIPLEQIYNAFGQNPPYNLSANVLNSLLSNGAAGTAAAPTTQTLDNAPLSFTPSKIMSYSLTIEQQVARSMVASVAYVGSQGRNLMTFQGGYDFNFPLPVSAPSIAGCLPAGQAGAGNYNFDPCINAGTVSGDYTRPYKGYSTMNNVYDEGSSNYNSLQSSLGYRAGNSQFSVSYTYGKVLATVGSHSPRGTTSQGAIPQNPRNFHAEYGPPSYDFTNDISGTWVYTIPGFAHSDLLKRTALSNWSLGGLVLHQSGFAMSPGLSISTSGLATRPDQVSPYRRTGRLQQWFDTSAYTAPPYGFFGDASNGQVRGPAYTSLNTALYKTFPLAEQVRLQFRAEAFNLFNHPNFEAVDTSLGDGSYGQVTSAGDPRILEFALRAEF
ncbi:MAG: carboxypeptidase regulatory-like domain-containing protein [Acidobacteriota bacterium]